MIKYMITSYEWFDKTYGNSYFSAVITKLSNKGAIDIAFLPFQYGYGDQYKHESYSTLVKLGLVKEEDRFNHELNNKRFIYVKHENCLKREVVNRGEGKL